MYRLGVERILGLNRAGSYLQIDPCIPKEWTEYEVDYRFGKTTYHIRIKNPHNVNRGVSQITMNGEKVDGTNIPLLDDEKTYEVVVTLS